MAETAGSLDIVLRAGVEMTSLGSAEVQKQTKGLIASTRAIDSNTNASKRNLGQIAAWALGWKVAYGAINLVTGAVRGSISNILHMEQEMARFSIVTGATGQSLKKVEGQVRGLARAYGLSSLEVAKAAKIYAQQGLTASQALELTEIAMRGVVVTGQSTEQMVENLTAAQRGYNLTARETEDLLDKWVAVAQKAPVSVDTLAQSYRRASAAAADLGINVDELNAMVSGLAGTMRLTGNQASTALTTIFMRLGREQSMAAVQAIAGVETIAPGGESMRSPFDILRDLAKGWDNLSGAQQRMITQQVAGIRRGKEFVAMLRSWDDVEKSLLVSQNATEESLDAVNVMLDTNISKWQQLKEAMLKTASWAWEHGMEIPFGPSPREIAIRGQNRRANVVAEREEQLVRESVLGAMQRAGSLEELFRFAMPPRSQRDKADAIHIMQGLQDAGYLKEGQFRDLEKAYARGGDDAFIRAAELIFQAANMMDDAGEKMSFGAGMYAVALRGRMLNPEMAKWFMGTAQALGLPGLELGGEQQPYKPREMMRMAEMVRMQGATVGMEEMAPRGAAGAQVALEVARKRREEALKLIDIIKQRENISSLEKAATEGSLLAQQMLTLEVKTQFDIVQAQLNVQKAIASEVRAAADAYKGAFGTGLKAIIKGEGTLSDLASGMGETVFQRNIDSLVDKLDKAFLSMGQTEFEWMRRGGVDAATTIAGAMKSAADYHASRLGMGGGGVGTTAGMMPSISGIAGRAGFPKSLDITTEQGVTDYDWSPDKGTWVNADTGAEMPAALATGLMSKFMSPAERGASVTPKLTGGQIAGILAMSAMQGYSLSGGKWEGALASVAGAGVGAGIGSIWGPAGAQAGSQIGSLLGALFRDKPEPEEEERRYQNRVEWENALLEQMVLMNRNLLGVREGGTFAMPGSYYYRARTTEALAGELELAMRG